MTSASGNTIFYIGTTETFKASTKMSDGSVKVITDDGIWTTDNDKVVRLRTGTGGVADIIGSGPANIFVSYGGTIGSLCIRAIPNYQGTWTGTYRIDGCTSSGDFLAEGFCDTFTGTEYPIELIMTQDINDVVGDLFLGSLSTSFWIFFTRMES